MVLKIQQGIAFLKRTKITDTLLLHCGMMSYILILDVVSLQKYIFIDVSQHSGWTCCWKSVFGIHIFIADSSSCFEILVFVVVMYCFLLSEASLVPAVASRGPLTRGSGDQVDATYSHQRVSVDLSQILKMSCKQPWQLCGSCLWGGDQVSRAQWCDN